MADCLSYACCTPSVRQMVDVCYHMTVTASTQLAYDRLSTICWSQYILKFVYHLPRWLCLPFAVCHLSTSPCFLSLCGRTHCLLHHGAAVDIWQASVVYIKELGDWSQGRQRRGRATSQTAQPAARHGNCTCGPAPAHFPPGTTFVVSDKDILINLCMCETNSRQNLQSIMLQKIS